MKYLAVLLITSVFLLTSCEECYTCSCPTAIEVNGVVQDTATTIYDECNSMEAVVEMEQQGCECVNDV